MLSRLRLPRRRSRLSHPGSRAANYCPPPARTARGAVPATDEPAADAAVRRALASLRTDAMCRVISSGTPAVGTSASGSELIAVPDGVVCTSWKPVRAPRVRASRILLSFDRGRKTGSHASIPARVRRAGAGARPSTGRDKHRARRGPDRRLGRADVRRSLTAQASRQATRSGARAFAGPVLLVYKRG